MSSETYLWYQHYRHFYYIISKMSTRKSRPSWPNAVSVSGLPLRMQGWNNVYVRQRDQPEDEYPIYVLPSYQLYGNISIAEATVSWSPRNCEWVVSGNGFTVARSDQIGNPAGMQKDHMAFHSLIGPWDDEVVVSTDCTSKDINIQVPPLSVLMTLLAAIMMVVTAVLLVKYSN